LTATTRTSVPAAQAGVEGEFRRYAAAALAEAAHEVGWETRPAVGTGDGYDRDRRRQFDQALAARGWTGIALPVEYGGAGRLLAEQVIFAEEATALGLSTPFNRVALGIVVPAIMLFGTEEQKLRYLPPILSTDEIWCQGFSENEAGSDLANLRTSAVRVGTGWTVNGHKIWTTLAADADYCLLLARTDSSVPKHRGITALTIPMRQPSITVTPIKQIDGQDDFAEVRFENAHAPAGSVLGEEGDGWRVAMAALGYERSLHLLQRQLRLARMVEELRVSVDWVDRGHSSADRMLDIVGSVLSLKRAVLSQLVTLDRGGQVGVEANASKVLWSETYQALARLGLDLALAGAGPDVAAWAQEYYASLATSIYAGTNEIQRSIIAERGLGMPR
jgi:alkylation response protein AidB-like acyl-CoA dehydrogenase